jgi:hypothetical protein
MWGPANQQAPSRLPPPLFAPSSPQISQAAASKTMNRPSGTYNATSPVGSYQWPSKFEFLATVAANKTLVEPKGDRAAAASPFVVSVAVIAACSRASLPFALAGCSVNKRRAMEKPASRLGGKQNQFSSEGPSNSSSSKGSNDSTIIRIRPIGGGDLPVHRPSLPCRLAASSKFKIKAARGYWQSTGRAETVSCQEALKWK